jgi:hypothetical protein
MSEGYSETEWHDIEEKVGDWIDKFFESRHFGRLAESHKREARGVIELFARYSYEYLGSSPGDWDRRGTRECCLEILPRKITAEPAFFEAIAPVLSEFFTFLDESALLRHAQTLATAVADLDKAIVSAASDPSQWGPAKGFMMKARAAEVDLGDQQAVQRFMLVHNLQMAQKLAQDRPTPAPPSISALPATPVPFRRLEAKVNRNDPCPCGSGKKFKRCCGA